MGLLWTNPTVNCFHRFDSLYSYEYQYLIKTSAEPDYQIIRPWATSNTFVLDSLSYLGKVQIQVRVRIANSNTMIATEQQNLLVKPLWTKEQCLTNTLNIVNGNNNLLSIPYLSYNNQIYHTKFDYKGIINGVLTWRLSTAQIASQNLPYGCNAKSSLQTNILYLTDFIITGSEQHYKARLRLEVQSGQFYLKLIDYNPL